MGPRCWPNTECCRQPSFRRKLAADVPCARKTIAGLQRRHQELLDIIGEALAGDRLVERARGIDPVNVIDAWGIASLDAYATVQRMGRKSRLGPNQRERLWPVFDAVRSALVAERYTTWAQVFTGLAEALAGQSRKPFDHIILDEAQDLAPAELRFFVALAPAASDALFLAGDMGQRIFQQPYSWSSLGVEVRGRSHTLNSSVKLYDFWCSGGRGSTTSM